MKPANSVESLNSSLTKPIMNCISSLNSKKRWKQLRDQQFFTSGTLPAKSELKNFIFVSTRVSAIPVHISCDEKPLISFYSTLSQGLPVRRVFKTKQGGAEKTSKVSGLLSYTQI